MNIYELQVSGEKEWIIAHTAIEAMQIYHDMNGMTIDDFEDTDDIVIVPESDWDKMKITYSEECLEGEEPPVITFREIHASTTIPEHIGQTVE